MKNVSFKFLTLLVMTNIVGLQATTKTAVKSKSAAKPVVSLAKKTTPKKDAKPKITKEALKDQLLKNKILASPQAGIDMLKKLQLQLKRATSITKKPLFFTGANRASWIKMRLAAEVKRSKKPAAAVEAALQKQFAARATQETASRKTALEQLKTIPTKLSTIYALIPQDKLSPVQKKQLAAAYAPPAAAAASTVPASTPTTGSPAAATGTPATAPTVAKTPDAVKK